MSEWRNPAANAAPAVPSPAPDVPTDSTLTIPVIEEDLHVERREVETGRLRFVKTVSEREAVVDEPILRDEVTIERVPLNQPWEGPPPPVRYAGDTMIIPLLEEVMVVEKRLVLKEELHVRRVRTTAQEPQTVTLRSEDIRVERVDPSSPGNPSPQAEPSGSPGTRTEPAPR
jgi:uncharacterized protein (TIGR02271 family)